MRFRALTILIGEREVGTLYQAGELSRFRVADDYANDANAPVVSLAWVSQQPEQRSALLRDTLHPAFVGQAGKLPSFFQNLLPEGLLRQHLASLRGCAPEDHFELLAACGRDLPGNIYALPANVDSATVQRLLADQSEPGQMLPVASALADGFSLSGMQPKLSLGRQGGRYTFRGRVDQHSVIGKLPTVDFPLLPEVEMLSMRLARLAGVETCECELVPMELLEDQGELPVATGAHFLAVSRFDRGANDRVHVEDFAQVFSVDPADKYRHITYLDIMRLMMSLPSLGQSAVEEMVRRLLVNELLGNYDAHLKNLGLIYLDGKTPTLSPAYDVVAYAAYLSGRGHALPILRTQDKHQLLSPLVPRTLCNELGLLEAPLRAVMRRCLAAALKYWEQEIAASRLLDQQKRHLLNHFRGHRLVAVARK